MTPPASAAPGIFALSDPKRVQELLSRAGFAPPEILEMPLTWEFHSADDYWWFLTEMAGAISPVLKGLDPEAQTRVRTRIAEMTQPFRSGDGYAFPALCVNVSTRRPPGQAS
jgi:hypothetical protein